ncbi:MAG: fibronectin type III domain-containing protein, partial [Chitinophagales bacterium]|nr:fibronectin type III domain-containing protein [Chitinophagales bacterium]
CDGEIDENSVYITYYADQDGDGYGNPTISQTTCDGAPNGYVTGNTDCDDNNANINPGQSEVPCNGVDDNCNGTIDEGSNSVTYYADQDGDGYGNPAISQTTCDGAPNGYVTGNTDCDDNNANINPGQSEVPCNGIDDNCNGTIDEGSNSVTYYADQDGDGYGNPAISQTTCDGAPNGYVTDNTDCNDNNANINPGQSEVPCNGVDDNCNGTIDEGSNSVTYYADQDGDGYGNPNESQTTCDGAPNGYVTTSTDCNDNNANVNPGQAEVPCNGIDDNCNGQFDENDQPQTYYLDSDGDGFGNPNMPETTCDGPPVGYVVNDLDCNDANAAINPNASEIGCNGLDDNCNGEIDENNQNIVYYLDFDGDGFGNPLNSIASCSGPPSGYIDNDDDCNDNDFNVYPGAFENNCNGIDDNCNGQIDENGSLNTYYIDADGDGFGNPNIFISTCDTLPSGYVLNNTDCKDNDANIYPHAKPYNTSISNVTSTDALFKWKDGSCETGGMYQTRRRPVGSSDTAWALASTYPPNKARKLVNLSENTTYEVQVRTFFGVGDASEWSTVLLFTTLGACTSPQTDTATNITESSAVVSWSGGSSGSHNIQYRKFGTQQWASTSANASLSQKTVQNLVPATTYEYRIRTVCSPTEKSGFSEIKQFTTLTSAEISCNGIDDNGNGEIDEYDTFIKVYADLDGDGYGDPFNSLNACNTIPSGYVKNKQDCNDTLASVHPQAQEIACNGIDDNCNGTIDENNVYITYYQDNDHDGYGTQNLSITTCDGAPFGFADNSDDCNDNDSTINPAGLDTIDGIDNDCDGLIDEGITYYVDMDRDSFGNINDPGTPFLTDPGVGYSRNNKDCNDNDSIIYPNARPYDTKISDISSSDALFKWKDGSCTPGVMYQTRRKPVGAPETDWALASTYPPSKTRRLVNLNEDTYYEVQVRTFFSDGTTSEWTALTVFKTLAACNSVTWDSVIKIEPTSVTVKWSGGSDARHAVFYRKVGVSNWNIKSTAANFSEIELTNLTPGVSYEYKIRTICNKNGNRSGFSPIHNFSTPPMRLMQPDNLSTLTNISNVQVVPNPNNGSFSLRGTSNVETEIFITITNLTGQVVYQTNNPLVKGAVDIKISFDAQEKGMYYINIQTETFRQTLPFVKM